MTDETGQTTGQTGQTIGQTGQTTGQPTAVPTTPPWGMYVAIFAILAVTVGAIVALLVYRGIFENPTDVTAVLGNWFTVVGTIVGAYFSIKASSDTNDKAL